MLHASGEEVYLYVADRLILVFKPLIDHVRNEILVYWFEED